MKILQLCKKFPYPLKDGETIAVYYLSKAMHELGCEITLMCMNTSKHYTDVSKLPEEFNHYKEIYFTNVDNNIRLSGAFMNLFTRESYHVSRFINTTFREQLINLLGTKTFDVVQLETLFLAPYAEVVRKHSNALISMRAHNVEHEIWERISNNTPFLPKKFYLKYLTRKLKRYEIQMLNEYDYLVALTKKDLTAFRNFGYKKDGISSPIGLDIDNYDPISIKKYKSVTSCFIGSLDWMPNREGLLWFLDKVWPGIHKKYPDFELHIAGRNTPDKIRRLSIQNVKIHGEVRSAIDFINSYSIMIVPLFSGSGMRVKILEGMALGKLVITTSLGLEGIDAMHKKEVLIANDPESFIDAIQFCFENPEEMFNISTRAQKFIHNYYDNRQNAIHLLASYESALKKENSKSL